MKGSEEAAPSSRVLWVDVLEIEARVRSIVGPEVPRGPEVADVADMVLPSASVVVRSHCFASAVLGRMGAGGLVALPPE